MADFIKRADALKVIETANSMVSSLIEATTKLCVTMDRIAAADVAPVRHGRWVLTTQPLGWRDEDCAECSECGEDFVLDEWGIDDVKDAMRYCPNCGALMDKDGDGE